MASFCTPAFIPEENSFGLVACDSDELIHLSEVNIFCNVIHLTSLVETTFVYKNQLKVPADAKFVFPLNDVAVFNFEATINDKVVVAECRPRKEAQTVYDEAVAKGHTAFIAHQDESCPDIFSLGVGQIPVGATVSIKLKYVGQLEVENVSTDDFKGSEAVFMLPSVICPRYSPPDVKIEKEFDPVMGTTWASFPYTIAFKADLRMPEVITSVTSEKDKYVLELDEKNPKCAKVSLSSGFKPDHSLQMCIRMDKPLCSSAVIEGGDQKRTSVLSQNCLMAQFLPDFSPLSDEQDLKTELIFIVDRSGSMSGSRIRQASESLMLFLSSIPPGCRFQIIGFGSTYATLFPEPVDYNENTVAVAQRYQSEMAADMGGTEILDPLRAAFDSPLTGHGWYKEVILLTDGDVMNVDEVVGLVASNVHKARVFPVGIGADASTHLISVARAGRGVYASVRDETQLRSTVVRILSSALQPRATITEVKWNLKMTQPGGIQNAVSLITAPTLPPPVFMGFYSTVYALFDGDPSHLTGEVSVRLQILDQERMLTIPIGSATDILASSDNAPVHRLAGKCLLNELNDQYKALQMQDNDADKESENSPELKNIRTRIEQISSLLNIISPYTSFVGVDPVKNEVLVPAQILPTYDVIDGPVRLRGGPCSPMMMASCPAPMNFYSGIQVDELSVPQCESLEHECDSADDADCFMDDKLSHNQPEPSQIIKLVQLQHFSGYWSLSKEVATLTESKFEDVQNKKPKTWPSSHKDLPDPVWATVVVLAYMELKMSDVKDEWILVARKAKTWLRKQAAHAGLDTNTWDTTCDVLIDLAKQCVGTQ